MKYRKKSLTHDERIALPKNQLQKIRRILKVVRDLSIESPYSKEEFETIRELLKDIQSKYQDKIAS